MHYVLGVDNTSTAFNSLLKLYSWLVGWQLISIFNTDKLHCAGE